MTNPERSRVRLVAMAVVKTLVYFAAVILGWTSGVFLYVGLLLVFGYDPRAEGGIHIGAGVLGIGGIVASCYFANRALRSFWSRTDT